MPTDSNDTSEAFFDTSILIYAYDKSEPEKQAIASQLVKAIFDREMSGYVSNQILSELYFVLTEKKGMSKEDVENIVLSFLDSDSWIKVNYDIQTVRATVKTAKTLAVIFWDILIGETMKENGILKIYTEDEKHFKKIPGIKVVNPLKG